MPGLFDEPLLSHPIVYMIAEWVGYLLCAIALAKLLLMAQQWYVTLRLYGRIPWSCIGRMVAFTVASQNFAKYAVISVAGVLVLLLPYVIPGTIHPVPLSCAFGIAMILLIGWLMQITPPSVLLLCSSRSESVDLRERLERDLDPYRIVVLLDPWTITAATHSDVRRESFEIDNLRTRDDAKWRGTVHLLAETVPIVLIDTRVASPAVVEETRRMLASHLLEKAVFLVGPEQDSPALTAVGAATPSVGLRTVEEAECVPHLKALGLTRATAGVLKSIQDWCRSND